MLSLFNSLLRRRLSRRATIIATLAACSCLATAMFAQPLLSVASPTLPRQDDLLSNPPPVISVSCTPDGFRLPDELNLRSGTYTFVIRNRSGYDQDLVLDLGKKGESSVVSKTLPWGETFVVTLTLDPGDYALTEVSRSEWEKTLTVAP